MTFGVGRVDDVRIGRYDSESSVAGILGSGSRSESMSVYAERVLGDWVLVWMVPRSEMSWTSGPLLVLLVEEILFGRY